jgi:hypothetical protein
MRFAFVRCQPEYAAGSAKSGQLYPLHGSRAACDRLNPSPDVTGSARRSAEPVVASAQGLFNVTCTPGDVTSKRPEGSAMWIHWKKTCAPAKSGSLGIGRGTGVFGPE